MKTKRFLVIGGQRWSYESVSFLRPGLSFICSPRSIVRTGQRREIAKTLDIYCECPAIKIDVRIIKFSFPIRKRKSGYTYTVKKGVFGSDRSSMISNVCRSVCVALTCQEHLFPPKM